MSSRRGTPRRVDANQAEIVAALRDARCCVQDASGFGGGFPDLIVWSPWKKEILLIEVKNPASKGRLNALQRKWHDTWRGQVCVVTSIAEALTVVGA